MSKMSSCVLSPLGRRLSKCRIAAPKSPDSINVLAT